MRANKEKELQEKIDRFKTIEKVLLNKNKKFITIDTFECHTSNGKTLVRDRINKGSGNGSAITILPITEDNNIVLVIQPRVFTKTTVGVELPAGYIESGEESVIAAERELKEETGLEAKSIEKVCGFYQDEGCSSAYVEGFIAKGCRFVSEQKLDRDEYIELFVCTIDEMLELVERGIISGVGSQFVIEKAKEYLKKLC